MNSSPKCRLTSNESQVKVELAIIYLQSYLCVSSLIDIKLEIHASHWINGSEGKFFLFILCFAGDRGPSLLSYLHPQRTLRSLENHQLVTALAILLEDCCDSKLVITFFYLLPMFEIRLEWYNINSFKHVTVGFKITVLFLFEKDSSFPWFKDV